MYYVCICMNICLVKLFLLFFEFFNYLIVGESGLSVFFFKILFLKFELYFDLNFVIILKKNLVYFFI